MTLTLQNHLHWPKNLNIAHVCLNLEPSQPTPVDAVTSTSGVEVDVGTGFEVGGVDVDDVMTGGAEMPDSPVELSSDEATDMELRCDVRDWLAWQVWSLSSFKVSCQLLKNDLNRVSSVSLLMTVSTALANKGLFELTRRPSLTRAVSSSFAETTEEPGCRQVKRLKFSLIWVRFKQISPDYSLVPC